jgi:hypothetical protein
LIDEKVEENDRLDYKRLLSLDTPAQRAEAAKDVSSFANTRGGLLVIGMVEKKQDGLNVPVALQPFTDPSDKDRLVDALYSYCVPNVHVDPTLIDVDGGYCLALEIPESIAPVFVAARGHNRYYKRYDTKSTPMLEQDVQVRYQRYLASRTAVERLIDEAKIVTGWPPSERPRPPWVSLVAAPAYGPVDIFNPATFERPKLLDLLRDRRTGLWDGLAKYRPTYFGLEASLGSEPYWKALLRLHRTGIIEYHHAVSDSDAGWVKVGNDEPERPSIALGHERSLLLEAIDIVDGLYRAAGYLSDLYLWGEYRIPGGWDLGSLPLYAPEPLDHSEWISVTRLAERQKNYVEALLDRVAQAAGLWSSRDVR